MRDLHDIAVKKGIVHLVAPRKQQFVLSEAELELSGNATVANFLAEHVDRGLRDPQARAANFVIMGDDRASGICDGLLGQSPNLVELSQSLVGLLYKVTSGDERVSDGTVAVLLCDGATSDGQRQALIALLKLDPSDAFRTVEKPDKAGRTVLGVEVESNILPKTRERLQKCVFVRPADPRADYRMLLVDRQGPGVARFFVADFMGAELVLDAEERTKRLYRSLRSARNQVAPQLSANDLAALDEVIRGTVAAATVNLDDLKDALPVPATTQQKINELVSSALPDREFELDRTIAQQIIRRRRRFEGDNGLRLSVPADFYDDMVQVEDEPGAHLRVRRITIKTQTWAEK